MRRRLLLLVCLFVLALPAVANGQSFPIYGGFHSVLAFGEGENTSATDLAAFEAMAPSPPMISISSHSTKDSNRRGRASQPPI